MSTKIDTLIKQAIQIAKYVALQPNQSFEERTATILQYRALSFLEKSKENKLSDVANDLQASLSSTTQLVERLHKGGLLERREDLHDRRVTLLTITKKGQERLKRMKENKRLRMKNLLSNIEQQDIDTLIKIQEKIIINLKKTE